jgi:hypothetical protein
LIYKMRDLDAECRRFHAGFSRTLAPVAARKFTGSQHRNPSAKVQSPRQDQN